MSDDEQLIYRASSFCTVGGCLEVGRMPSGDVIVRDSKHPETTIRVGSTEWATFVEGVKAGEFDPA